ncbi:MAG TPA: hypothetical protein VGD33_03865, partial [Chitinophagaceae bacterium]
MSRAFFVFILLVLIVLQGCVTSKEIFLADGTKGHNINCSGSGMNYSNCLEKAGEICGARGYHILNQQGEVVPFSAAIREFGSSMRPPSIGYLTQSGAIITRNLFVKCK